MAAFSHLPHRGIEGAHKSEAWKVAVTMHLRETTDVPNGWLAEQLNMGSAAYVSKHVGLAQRQPTPAIRQCLEQIRVKGEA